MALLKNSLIVSVWTGLSRVLGFARDLVIANKLGAGVASDAFFVALMLPNLLRRLFAEGAFNVAFVPLLAQARARGTDEALAFASVVFSWLLVIVSAVVVVGLLAMPGLVALLASGWLDDPARFELAVQLGRITFPYLGLITIAAFLGALCNTFGQFAAYAMVPAFLNLSIVLCLFVLPWAGKHPAEAAAWAVPLGGVAQVAYMAWAARRLGLRVRFMGLVRHEKLKELLYLFGPAALGVGVLQLSILADTAAASFVEGAPVLTYLQNANRFYQFPLSLVGIAVATVLLPHLAVLLGQGGKAAATRSFTQAFGVCLTLATGAAVGLLVLAPEIMQTLLMHGAYTQTAALATAGAMMAYVAGLPAYMATKVTAPAFFAAKDPGSPVRASLVALGINVSINALAVLYLPTHLAHVGIAAGTAVGGYANAALQWHWLARKGVLAVDTPALYRLLSKLVLVAVGMAAVLVAFKLLWPYEPAASLPARAVWLAVSMGLGAGCFMVLVQMLGLLRWQELLRILKNRKKTNLPSGPAGGGD